MEFIDSHCHLNAPCFTSNIEDVIASAKSAGVVGAVVVTEYMEDFERTLMLAEQFKGFVYPCLGVHPVQKEGTVQLKHVEEALMVMAQHVNKMTAVGEIGLDFTPWICSSEEDKEIQREVLRKQLMFAKHHSLPVNLHSRSAAREVVQILKKSGITRALLHNFAGRKSVAREAVQLGYKLSFPPRVCLQPDRRSLLEWLPVHALCLETDSPALGCHEGINTPSEILKVFEHINSLKKNLDKETLARACLENTRSVFGLR